MDAPYNNRVSSPKSRQEPKTIQEVARNILRLSDGPQRAREIRSCITDGKLVLGFEDWDQKDLELLAAVLNGENTLHCFIVPVRPTAVVCENIHYSTKALLDPHSPVELVIPQSWSGSAIIPILSAMYDGWQNSLLAGNLPPFSSLFEVRDWFAEKAQPAETQGTNGGIWRHALCSIVIPHLLKYKLYPSEDVHKLLQEIADDYNR